MGVGTLLHGFLEGSAVVIEVAMYKRQRTLFFSEEYFVYSTRLWSK